MSSSLFSNFIDQHDKIFPSFRLLRLNTKRKLECESVPFVSRAYSSVVVLVVVVAVVVVVNSSWKRMTNT